MRKRNLLLVAREKARHPCRRLVIRTEEPADIDPRGVTHRVHEAFPSEESHQGPDILQIAVLEDPFGNPDRMFRDHAIREGNVPE